MILFILVNIFLLVLSINPDKQVPLGFNIDSNDLIRSIIKKVDDIKSDNSFLLKVKFERFYLSGDTKSFITSSHDVLNGPLSITCTNCEPNQLYTILCIDPDAPDPYRPIMAPWLHYLALNIRGDNFSNITNPHIPWTPPTPPIGLHHYLFVAIQQEKHYPPSYFVRNERARFDISKFPNFFQSIVGANYFKCRAFSSK